MNAEFANAELKKIIKDQQKKISELENLFNVTPDMICVAGTDGYFKYLNPEWEKVLGYSIEELLSLPLLDFIHPEDVKSTIGEINSQQKGACTINFENRYRCKDGSYKILEWRTTPAEEGKLFAVARDITLVRQTTEELMRSQERFELAMEAANDGLYDWDLKTNGIYYSPGWKRMLGYEDSELANDFSIWEGLIKPEDAVKSWEMQQELVEKKRDRFDLEFKMKHKDGYWVDILSRAKAIFDDSGKAVRIIGTHVDVSERKRFEASLLHAQKMESIGNLAGGIAHEFNNMLTIIMGNNELVMHDLPQGSLARESTKDIQIAGIRARDVVKQLLTFSRQDDAVQKVMDLKFVVEESIKLIRSSTPVNIKIEQNLSADTYLVMGNDTQINQLLINLCNNAVDALPEKAGILTIELLNETIDIQQTEHQTKLPPGQYAKLMVSDNGIGMDTEILDRVFEPYFTTKNIGEGTGIGMAVVHGVVKRHGGAIIVDSKPGRGTTFTTFLPAQEGLLERETDEVDILPVGDEYILYVDDEPSIATLGKRLLESLGYTTESTTDPEKALDMVRSDPNKFDLLITDMAMPDMTGDQLVIETLKIRQDMPTIICTGYSAKISEEEAMEIGVRSYIMKPIKRSDLAKIVRKVLDGAKRSNLVNP